MLDLLAKDEFALAEHGYRETALEDLLGVPDTLVTKDRLYRTLDALLAAKAPIERDLKVMDATAFALARENQMPIAYSRPVATAACRPNSRRANANKYAAPGSHASKRRGIRRSRSRTGRSRSA